MSTSVGQELREARQAKNQSLEQVSRVTHIRPRYLEALEAGDLAALPSNTQARGFLRAYALHLGLDATALLGRLGTSTDAPLTPAQPEETPPPEMAVGRYPDIADILRIQRETLGVSLDEAEKQTRVRKRYLEALEKGDLEKLPSPVQGRGMLKNYAGFLGLDPEPLLLDFAEGLQQELANRRARDTEDRSRGRRSPIRRLLSGDLVFGGIFLLGLVIFVIWAIGRVSAVQASQTPVETAPSIVDILDPIPTETATPSQTPTVDPLADTPDPAAILDLTETAVPTQPITNDAPVQVYIVVVERTWMRVIVDGQIEFEGRVIPGSAYPFSGRQEIQLLVSSGSALEIIYNQQNLGPLGLFGQIVERIYTAEGVLLPTPAESPTPTPSVTPTPTETPTATPEG
jgi:cytoskeletal protein RodZ